MRIALLDVAPPRGAEAGIGRVAAWLAERGDGVAILHGEGAAGSIAGVELRRLWRPPRLPAERFYEDDLALAPAAIWQLLRGHFDAAHAFAPALGWAAAQARRIGGPRFAYSHRGGLDRRWLVARHYRIEMLRATAAAASACFVDDGPTAAAFRRYLLRDAEVVAGAAGSGRYDAAYTGPASG